MEGERGRGEGVGGGGGGWARWGGVGGGGGREFSLVRNWNSGSFLRLGTEMLLHPLNHQNCMDDSGTQQN